MRSAVSAAWPSQAIQCSRCGLRSPGSTTPPVWRQLVIPAGYTLDRVHDAIQVIMGWQDSHLHVLRIAGREYDPAYLDDELEMLTKRIPGSVIW